MRLKLNPRSWLAFRIVPLLFLTVAVGAGVSYADQIGPALASEEFAQLAVETVRRSIGGDFVAGRTYDVRPDQLTAAVALFPGRSPRAQAAASAFSFGDALLMQFAYRGGRLEMIEGEIITRQADDRTHNEFEDFHAYVIETLSTMREPGVEVCQLNAWSASSDPEGVPVYSRPRLDSEQLGRLAPPSSSILPERAPEGGWRTLFTITGSVPGWFRIAEPWDPGTAYASEPQPVDFPSFKGEGWIEARHAGAHYGNSEMPVPKLMSHPNPDAAPLDPRLAAADAKGNLKLAGTMSVMLACSANWLFSESIDGNRGWWRTTCINEEGQCR